MRLVLAVLVIASFLVAGCGRSSYDASTAVLRQYPGSELHEIPRSLGVVEFLVRTPDNRVINIVFADDGNMLPPVEIFPARPKTP